MHEERDLKSQIFFYNNKLLLKLQLNARIK